MIEGKRNPFSPPPTAEQWEKGFRGIWNPAHHDGETYDEASRRWADRDTPISAILHEMNESTRLDNGRAVIAAAFGEEFMLELENAIDYIS